jgi:hypothetical protein
MYNKCSYEAGEPVFTVPINKEDALVDRRHFYNKKLSAKEKKNTTQKALVKRVSVYPCHFHDESNQNLFPHGFPIHDNCWRMATRVIGVDRIEKSLNSFLVILQQLWADDMTIAGSRQIVDWIVNERGSNCTMHAWYANIASLTTDRSHYDVNRILVAMNDPVHVDEVEEMIAESARRYRATKKEELNDEEHDDDWATSSVATVTSTEHSFHSVPQEALMNILDRLHHSEVEVLLSATELRVPQVYWRRRAPRIIWELETIDEGTTPLDWQYLCLRAERMCEESLGLINRQRICNILHEVDRNMD